MDKSKIINGYQKKIEKFKKLNEAYYDKNKPLVTDDKYDSLKIELLDLEKKYKFLKDDFSPRTSVGFKPSKNFKKIAHKEPMLSLANAFDEKDLENFEQKILNYLNKTREFIIEYRC